MSQSRLSFSHSSKKFALCVFLLDFSENYSFLVQDAAQGFQ